MNRLSRCLALLAVCSALALEVAPAQTRTVIPANDGTVEGVVAKVFTSNKGNTFLNIGATYPNQTGVHCVRLH